MGSVARERLCDWVVNKDAVWVHGDRIADGRVALDMRLIDGLDPDVVHRDGQWRIRKHTFPVHLGDDHPDLTDVLPAPGPGWSPVRWSNWSTGGVRIGAVDGQPVAVDHAWLSRLPDGYRLEGSPDHDMLRIVTTEPAPALLTGSGTPQHLVVGVVVPVNTTTAQAGDGVLRAIVDELSAP